MRNLPGIVLVLLTGMTQHCNVLDRSGGVVRREVQKSPLSASHYPGFAVKVMPSENATTTLSKNKESVLVIAYLTGKPKPGARKKYFAHPGPIGLGEIEVEVPVGEVAKFREIEPKVDAFEQTDKQVPGLLINVVSGRRSSKDNLLDCDIYEGPVAPIRDGVIPINCKLIAEGSTR